MHNVVVTWLFTIQSRIDIKISHQASVLHGRIVLIGVSGEISIPISNFEKTGWILRKRKFRNSQIPIGRNRNRNGIPLHPYPWHCARGPMRGRGEQGPQSWGPTLRNYFVEFCRSGEVGASAGAGVRRAVMFSVNLEPDLELGRSVVGRFHHVTIFTETF